ncbi:hypothetical protein G647_01348 [Cladophialophora carrionii CBS 160.54]|uniref:Uncharacterized protein n=1 Tax=Cladophialophora carrionii CBS 160.54 TaxID=1279043 RepID=V9DQI7_9EURO|nr:uncharacterized protein G647_01348 [Cladophialophora carrionii CBS 160.54]ETI28896.1 hypothetical protein G647_01348 [Cladophialophora carrionii CBS 160.54]
MTDPTSVLTAGKKIIDYAFRLIAVSAESREAQKYLEQFERELDDLCILARSTWPQLDARRKSRVQRVMVEAREAILAVAEPNQQSLDDVERFGTVTIYRRILWTLRDNDSIKLYMPRVYMSHAEVSREIGILESVASGHQASSTATAHSDDDDNTHIDEETIQNHDISFDGPRDEPTSNTMPWLGELFARNNHTHNKNVNTTPEAPRGGPQGGLSWLGEEFNRRRSEDMRRRSRSRDPSAVPTPTQ